MSTQNNLVRLGITSSALLGAAFFPQLAPALGLVEVGQNLGGLGILLGCMASVAGGNVANAIDAFQPGREPDWVSLDNEDLTRTVGKAIASVLMLVVKRYKPQSWLLQNQSQAQVYKNLPTVAKAATDNWLSYIKREDYSTLREENIEAIIAPVLAGRPSPVLLSSEDWQDIFVWLNLKAQAGGGFVFPPELYDEVAQALTEHFPKALLQVLKDDFAKDGRAYTALSLRLLTGLRTQLEVPTGLAIEPTLKTEILVRLDELETGLRAEATATFRVLATQMQSVITNINQVLAELGKIQADVGAIKTDVAEIKEDVKTLLIQAQQPAATVSRSIPSNLPFSATDQFIGRQEQLTQLNAILQQESCLAICAVAGMGGIGKTELALQYALQFSNQYPGGLCWLSCRGADLGLQLLSFGRNSLDLAIPEQGEMAEQLAFCWNHWPGGNVLLIYDDVTDYSTLPPYLPPRNFHRFTALLTSRLQPNRVSGMEKIDLAVLSLPEALALLTALVGSERIEAEPERATALCEWVGCLPLALELMGAYLAESEDLTLGEFWEELQTDRLEAEAFEALAGELRTPLGVAQTFELSWQALSSPAQALAVRLSLFASAPFSWEWVEAQLPESERRDAKKCRDRELLKRSVLQRAGEGIYELHPLLREFLVTKQADRADLEPMKRDLGAVMVAIAQQVPYTVTLTDLAAVQPAVPHLAEVAENLSDWLNQENEELIWPFIALGRIYEGQSQFTQAEKWFGLCVETCKKRLGDRHPDTATSYNNLAGLYESMGRYEEALPLHQLALEIRKEQLGDRHPYTATSYNNLAALYDSMGRYEEALPLYELALEIYQTVLGEDHPNTQIFRRNYEACLRKSQQ